MKSCENAFILLTDVTSKEFRWIQFSLWLPPLHLSFAAWPNMERAADALSGITWFVIWEDRPWVWWATGGQGVGFKGQLGSYIWQIPKREEWSSPVTLWLFASLYPSFHLFHFLKAFLNIPKQTWLSTGTQVKMQCVMFRQWWKTFGGPASGFSSLLYLLWDILLLDMTYSWAIKLHFKI